MHACMYVYMCVCIYSCMYECMYVRIYVCMCLCMHASMYVCMCLCMHVCMYICVYVCMYVVCMYVTIYIYICMSLILYVCTCVCMRFLCMHVCVYVCIFKYMYMDGCVCVCVCMWQMTFPNLQPRDFSCWGKTTQHHSIDLKLSSPTFIHEQIASSVWTYLGTPREFKRPTTKVCFLPHVIVNDNHLFVVDSMFMLEIKLLY